jgi:hypothetical protein
MQSKTNNCSPSTGVNTHRQKRKILGVNAAKCTPILLDDHVLDEVDNFTYLASIVDKQGETEADPGLTRTGQHSIN